MKRNIKHSIFHSKLILFCLVLSISLLTTTVSFGGEMVAIINKGNPVTELSKKDLQHYFKGKKKTWENGEPVILFLPKIKSAPMKWLAKNIFKKKKSGAVLKFYLKAVFQQKFADPPAAPNDPVLEVAAVPGGLAVVDTDTTKNQPGIRVLKIPN
ncbi:MAG: hypothetical protein ACE5EK_05280 [Nitrospinales bacterium]